MPPNLSEEMVETGGLRAFRSRDFTLLWVGNLLSNIGSWMQNVAEPWLVLQLSNSPFLVGLDSFAGDAPVWFLILVGGLLADRRDRRKTILLFQGIQLGCPITLVLLLVIGRVSVPVVIALSLIVGITDALSGPSIMALIPSSVPAPQVPDAVALNSIQFNLSRVLGPLIAGVVMAGLGATACFAFNAASYLPLFLAIWMVRLPGVVVRMAPGEPDPSAEASLLETLRLISKTATLRRAVLTVMITGLLCGPIITFAPVLIRDGLHRGSGSFGGTLSAYGVGGLVGAGVVLLLRNNRTRQIISSLAALGVGGLVVAVALLPQFALVLLAFCLIGAGMVASNSAANTILQSSIESSCRGRVSSVYTLALRGSLALGSILTGLVVARFGVRNGLLVNGLVAVALHLWSVGTIRRELRALS